MGSAVTSDELLSRARAICSHCCAPFAEVTDEHVAEAMVCFWEVLALAEQLQDALVEVTAEKLYPFNMPRWERLPDEDFGKMMFSGLSETFHGKNFYREQAREELSIQKRPRFSELERDAIEHAITTLDRCLLPLSDSLEDEMTIKILRKMLEE